MNKSQMLQDMLLNEINAGHYKQGEAIPSRNQLCRKYKCSRNTVERAIALLKEKGCLISNQGGATRVAAIHQNSGISEISEIYVITGLRHEYSERSIREMYFPGLDTNIGVKAIRESEMLRCLDAVTHPGAAVIWATPGIQSISLMAHLERIHVPQLLINRRYLHYNFAGTDTSASLRIGLDWLCSNAGKSCALISGAADLSMPYLSERLIAFYETAAEKGVRIIQNHVQTFTDLPAQISDIGAKLFKSGKVPFGIVVLDARLTVPLVTLGHIYGKTPGRDYFLLTYDYHQELVKYSGIGMLRQSYEQIYSESRRWLLDGSAAKRLPFYSAVPCTLVFGNESTVQEEWTGCDQNPCCSPERP